MRVHLKLDTGMGRWGLSELPALGPDVVGLMSHLATADSDPAFAEEQVERFIGYLVSLTPGWALKTAGVYSDDFWLGSAL